MSPSKGKSTATVAISARTARTTRATANTRIGWGDSIGSRRRAWRHWHNLVPGAGDHHEIPVGREGTC